LDSYGNTAATAAAAAATATVWIDSVCVDTYSLKAETSFSHISLNFKRKLTKNIYIERCSLPHFYAHVLSLTLWQPSEGRANVQVTGKQVGVRVREFSKSINWSQLADSMVADGSYSISHNSREIIVIL
jgi:hypothetical protein